MAKRKPTPKRRAQPGSYTPAQIAAATAARNQSTARTPGEVLDAFSPLPLAVSDLVLRPISLGTFMLLERIESPFADESGAAEISATDIARTVYILTRPEADVLAQLAMDRGAFDAGVMGLASRIPLEDLTAIGLKLRTVFTRAFSTVVGGGGQKKTEASSSLSGATASAGG